MKENVRYKKIYDYSFQCLSKLLKQKVKNKAVSTARVAAGAVSTKKLKSN